MNDLLFLLHTHTRTQARNSGTEHANQSQHKS